MSKSFREHERGDRVKWVAVFTAVILLAIAVTAGITKGFKDWNPYGWFGKKPAEKVEGSGVYDPDGNELVGGKVYPMSSRMLFSAPSAASATASGGVTIAATIEPADATNKGVDWTVSFVNAASSWATGKTATTYLTATPTADGSLTATIACLEAFGEQIKITVRSRENPNAKAECVIDYVKKLQGGQNNFIDVTLDAPYDEELSEYILTWDMSADGGSSYYTVSPDIQLSVGTFDDTFVSSFSFELNVSFIELLVESGITVPNIPVMVTDKLYANAETYKSLFGEANYNDPAKRNAIRTIMLNAQADYVFFELVGTVTGKYSSASSGAFCMLDLSVMPIFVEGVTLDNSTRILGGKIMTKTKRTYTILIALFAVMAAAVLTTCGLKTSAKAEGETPVIAYQVDALGNRSITHTYFPVYPGGTTEVTWITSTLKKDGVQVASAVWCKNYPDEGPNFAQASLPIELVFTDRTGEGNDYSYQPIEVAPGDYTLSFTYEYESRTPKTLTSNELPFRISASLPLPETPTKEGYTFTGWYFDEACTRAYDGSPITEETTLYAGWTINRYTVTFNPNGGLAVEPVIADWNTVPTLPTPTREGYDFLGWYNGSEQYADAPITEDISLVARWQIKTFTVTFMNGSEVVATVTVEYGQTFEVAMNAAKLQYYNLLNAAGEVTGKGEKITGDVTAVVKEMTRTEKVGAFLANNWWILVVAGVLIVLLLVALIAASTKRRRR